MSITKRGKTYWVDFTAPNGQRIRKSTGTEDKTLAQEYHDKLKVEYWRIQQLGEQPKYSWNDAVVKWLKESDHKSTIDKDKEILRWMDSYLGGMQLNDIRRDKLDEIAEAKAESSSKATANRYMALVRSILRRAAFDWEWLDKPPKIRMYPLKTRRVRWITREQAETLISHLPEHQAVMARLAVTTGLRQRNVSYLEWSQVDLNRKVAWIHPDQAKAKKAIGVALNTEAMSVLRGQVGKHPDYVFPYNGKPMHQVNTKAWRKSVEKAGLVDFRWHDLRHTWASWHAQAGTPLHVLQTMGGWETTEMVQRYAHLAVQHLAEHAERIAPDDTITSQPKLRLVGK